MHTTNNTASAYYVSDEVEKFYYKDTLFPSDFSEGSCDPVGGYRLHWAAMILDAKTLKKTLLVFGFVSGESMQASDSSGQYFYPYHISETCISETGILKTCIS